MFIIAKTQSFLNKSREDKLRATDATLRQLLSYVGYSGSTERVRRRVAGEVEDIRSRMHLLAVIERERYVKELLSDTIYNDPRRLPPHGFKIYSQHEEDGIIQEIFARIGCISKTFVEFGVGNGLENNTLKLLLEDWSGLWMEGSSDHITHINAKFQNVIRQRRLQVQPAFIDRDNVNELVGRYYTGEIDLISIDVDGNDLYLLEALNVVSPRLIIIEYNGKFPPPLSIAQTYNPRHSWSGTDYGGSSLAAIVKVAEHKNYSLVGCNITGTNAFFVRNDLLEDKFCPPYTAENHFQPARYFLWPAFVAGHPPDWGSYKPV